MERRTRGMNVVKDEYNLQRFLDAQAGIYDQVLQELESGRKGSHWMWFIFPQIKGLGFSSTSKFFAISSISEARAFVAHPVLGSRLGECICIILELERHSAKDIFGDIDSQKLASSMTLFANVTEPDSIYQRVLDKYFEGDHDNRTLVLLND
jgi:uncharacterized protein (DUF1810 family)